MAGLTVGPASPWQDNNGSSISHPHWRGWPPMSREYHLFIATLICCVEAVSISGNGIIVYALSRCKSLRTAANLLVGNLSVADLLMALTDLCFLVVSSIEGKWIFNREGCFIYGGVITLVSLVSISSLTMIAIDRYMVVVKCFTAFRKVHKGTAIKVIVGVWFYSLFWSLSPFCGWGNYVLESAGTSCTFDYLTRSARNRSFVLAITLVAFVLPVIAMVICYASIVATIVSHERQTARLFESGTRRARNKRTNVELKTTQAASAAILLFCGAWLPYATVAMIGQFGDTSLLTPKVSSICGIMAKAATVLDPLLYAISNQTFRKKIAVLCSMGRSGSRRLGTSFSATSRRGNRPLDASQISQSRLSQVDTTVDCHSQGPPDRWRDKSIVLAVAGSGVFLELNDFRPGGACADAKCSQGYERRKSM